MTGRRPRPRPCATCPYRRDVPSGLWAAEEYDRLPGYDGDTPWQNPNPFGCHSNDGETLCSGWVACHDPEELLAVRIGVPTGSVDPSTLEYRTDVPVFASGAEAAEHGKRDMHDPGPAARAAIRKLWALRRGERDV